MQRKAPKHYVVLINDKWILKGISPRARNVLRGLLREADSNLIVSLSAVKAQDGRAIRGLRDSGLIKELPGGGCQITLPDPEDQPVSQPAPVALATLAPTMNVTGYRAKDFPWLYAFVQTGSEQRLPEGSAKWKKVYGSEFSFDPQKDIRRWRMYADIVIKGCYLIDVRAPEVVGTAG